MYLKELGLKIGVPQYSLDVKPEATQMQQIIITEAILCFSIAASFGLLFFLSK